MDLNPLSAISPIDGRYQKQTEPLSTFFSEFALIKYRVRIEIEYFIELCKLPLPQLRDFDPGLFPQLQSIYQDFANDDALKIKEIERVVNFHLTSFVGCLIRVRV